MASSEQWDSVGTGSIGSPPPLASRSGQQWREHMRGRLKENLPAPEELVYMLGDELGPVGHLMTEKGWEHGWGIEGHPYIAHSNMFIMEEAGKEVGAAKRSGPAVAPPWAPRYAYPRALDPDSEAPKDEQKKNPLDILVQDALESPEAKLPHDAMAAIEDVALAFQRCDKHEFMMALDRLQACQERVCSRQGNGAGGPALDVRMQAFERELLKRFAKLSFSDPEAHAAFLESLPGPIRNVLEPIRLVEEAAKVLAPERKAAGASNAAAGAAYNWDQRPAPASILPYQQDGERKRPAQIGKTELNCEKPGMSQAVIKLPWSSEEKWERRIEQDLMWHPGCYFAAHQANPNQRK
eukprot:TRINITY_DN102723_c0_g1_i1.p2 TRINITY_DN102723_c0_g1~~TRINITY_DN102723_c0_g1_i1.p2  ORF type:complete len:352 (-),score=77.44 TRINITY_DN102723_c0_g1_i1:144-1199(-)